MQMTQQQVDDVQRMLTEAADYELPEAVMAQLEDPNRPGSFFTIPLWLRAMIPAVKRLAEFAGVSITIPTLDELIARVQSSNLQQWAKAAVLSALLWLKDHPGVLPAFV